MVTSIQSDLTVIKDVPHTTEVPSSLVASQSYTIPTFQVSYANKECCHRKVRRSVILSLLQTPLGLD